MKHLIDPVYLGRCFIVLIVILVCTISIHAQPIDTLLLQGRQLFDKGNYAETIEFLNSKEKEFIKAKTDKYCNYLDLMGQTYIKLSKFTEAEELLIKAQSALKNKKSTDYANILSSLGSLYRNTGSYAKSEKYYIEELSIREKISGKEQPDYATNLMNLGNLYYSTGDYSKSEKYYLEAKIIREKIYGKDHPNYALTLNNLGSLYNELGNYSEAESYYLEAKTIREKSVGNQHPSYAISLNNLASLYYKYGNYADAEKYFLEAKTIFEKNYGKHHTNYAAAINNLASVYYNMGNFAEAEKYYLETITIFEKSYGKEHPNYAATLNNLGKLYSNMEKYAEAEKFYTEAKAIYEKVLGNEHPNYAVSLDNLGNLFYKIHDYNNAEKNYLEAKRIYEKVLSNEHPNYAGSLNKLGFLYSNTGNYEDAKKYFIEAKNIREKILGKEHPNYITSLNNLGLLYSNLSNYDEAEKLWLEAKTILEKIFGKEHPKYANTLNYLGGLYKTKGNYTEAEKYYTEAKVIYEKVYGKENPDYALVLNNLASLYFITENYEQVQANKIEADNITKVQVENNFSFLSERQRNLFWEKNKINFEIGYSYVSASPVSSMTVYAYNNTLFTKGLLLRTLNGIKEALYSSHNEELVEKYEYLRNIRLTLAGLQSKESPDIKIIETLEDRADSLDKALTKASLAYSDFNKDINLKWHDIRDVLQPDEAAIEFVHFKLYDGKRWADTTFYAALLLKKDIDAPIWIPLFDEKTIHDLTRSKTYNPQKYTKNLFEGAKGDSLYNLIWAPLEKELKNIRAIYYSPSGLLHQVSFAAIPTGKTHLSDKYNLHLVSSTREIVNLKKIIAGDLPQGTASIYGGLWYDVDKEQMIAESENNSTYGKISTQIEGIMVAGNISRVVRDGVPWNYLPGTKREAEQISKHLEDKQLQHYLYSTSSGNEESFKQLSGTNTAVIHIATHGYFLDNIDYEYDRDISSSTRGGLSEDNDVPENPMLRSGLLLSGSNRAWTGLNVVPGIEDGILTAEEISGMNLINTKLVVLSACKTGLGEANTYEGVFGLQRAFKLAGVETIIMSLWSVPDNATAELMIEFYQSWLSGKNKYEAFRTAQNKIHEKYEEPYFWAGFVMMD